MHIYYEFLFGSGRIESFDLWFDLADFSLRPLPAGDEDWTRLEYHQCELCPLAKGKHAGCPVARNLSHILSRFRSDHSDDRVRVRATMEERVTEHKGDLKTGLCSIMGLVMATSGCPILDTFKPMAFTHLPFANERETTFRAASSYLMAQYVRQCHGLEPDWALSGFIQQYQLVRQVNAAFANRLECVSANDANLNALLLLDALAQNGAIIMKDNWLADVEPLFAAHLGS